MKRLIIFALALWPSLALAQVEPQVDAVSGNILRGVASLGARILEDEKTITQLTVQLNAITKERDELRNASRKSEGAK